MQSNEIERKYRTKRNGQVPLSTKALIIKRLAAASIRIGPASSGQNRLYSFRNSRLFSTNKGRKKKIPMTDITNPPMVPAANGNQKASFSVPTMKGMKPKMVETTVRKMGTTFAFQALV